MKTFLNALLILVTLTHTSTYSGTRIDQKRMLNPALNACKNIIGIEQKTSTFQPKPASQRDLLFAEESFLNWILSAESDDYLKDFDVNNFHYQFVPFYSNGVYKMGIIAILPELEIEAGFYEELGCGLEIPLERCMKTYTSWFNNGEILSAVVTMKDGKIEQFKNWRLEQEEPVEQAINSYYAELSIHYKADPEDVNLQILQYVDGTFRKEIPANELHRALLPKGRVSSLVFIANGRIKGILCYDLDDIRGNCPMTFATEVYLKERFGYGRILYTRPRCETIYTWSILNHDEFENLTTLNTEKISSTLSDYSTNQ